MIEVAQPGKRICKSGHQAVNPGSELLIEVALWGVDKKLRAMVGCDTAVCWLPLGTEKLLNRVSLDTFFRLRTLPTLTTDTHTHTHAPERSPLEAQPYRHNLHIRALCLSTVWPCESTHTQRHLTTLNHRSNSTKHFLVIMLFVRSFLMPTTAVCLYLMLWRVKCHATPHVQREVLEIPKSLRLVSRVSNLLDCKISNCQRRLQRLLHRYTCTYMC